MEKQYRRTGWDYSKNGYYFITICTKDRVNYFGEIVDNEMYLSEIGIMVNKFWIEIINHNSLGTCVTLIICLFGRNMPWPFCIYLVGTCPSIGGQA